VACEVEWAESTIAALVEQLDYIARDSPSYAATLSIRAGQAAASLDHFPGRGRVVPEYHDQTVREIQVSSYRLIYRVAGDKVRIIAFVHTARNLAALIRGSET